MKNEAAKKKVLIVEDDKSTQLLYSKVFSTDLFESKYDEDGETALATYASWKPDLIVLDMMLPVMTGFSVLKKIRKDFHDTTTPIVVSTSLAGKEDIIECSQQGIQGYIIKPFNFKELRKKFSAFAPQLETLPQDDATAAETDSSQKEKPQNTLKKYLSSYSAGNMGKEEMCVKIMKAVDFDQLDLPSLPDIVFKINEAITNTETTYKDIAELLATDQGISATLINLSNSPFYRGVSQCVTVEDAIMRVGLKETLEVVSVITNRSLYALIDPRFENHLADLFRHSVACGVASRVIAEHLHFDNVSLYFTLGVLHDLGKLLLIRVFSELFEKEEQMSADSLMDIVNSLHNTLGAKLIKKIGFPDLFANVAQKHEKLDQKFSNFEKELPLIIVANLYTKKFGYGHLQDDIDVLETTAAIYLHVNDSVEAKIQKGIAQYFKMLGVVT